MLNERQGDQCAEYAWNLYNFRAGLIRALVAEGCEVVAVAPPDESAVRLPELGCRFVPLAMDNRGTHPGRDLLLWCLLLPRNSEENCLICQH
jgi:hypothetical protein